METIVLQTTPSQLPDDRQVPASAIKKPVEGLGWSRESGLDGTLDKVRAPTETSVRDGFMQSDALVSPQLEEFFEGVIDEIGNADLKLRTVSSSGEEGTAWLPIDRIPESEQPFIELGAPVRVSIVVSRGKKANERRSEIRILRPSQWRPSRDTEVLTDFVLNQLKAVLGGK